MKNKQAKKQVKAHKYKARVFNRKSGRPPRPNGNTKPPKNIKIGTNH